MHFEYRFARKASAPYRNEALPATCLDIWQLKGAVLGGQKDKISNGFKSDVVGPPQTSRAARLVTQGFVPETLWAGDTVLARCARARRGGSTRSHRRSHRAGARMQVRPKRAVFPSACRRGPSGSCPVSSRSLMRVFLGPRLQQPRQFFGGCRVAENAGPSGRDQGQGMGNVLSKRWWPTGQSKRR